MKLFTRFLIFALLFSPATPLLANDLPVRECNSPPSVQSGICNYTEGSESLLIQAHILAPNETLINGQLLVDGDGRIACTACDCSEEAEVVGASTLYCRDATLSPGLIDAENFLRWSDAPIVDHGAERYEHRHDWRRGRDSHTELNITQVDGSGAWGEIRALISGTTSIASSSGFVVGLTRNLMRSDYLDGVTGPAWD